MDGECQRFCKYLNDVDGCHCRDTLINIVLNIWSSLIKSPHFMYRVVGKLQAWFRSLHAWKVERRVPIAKVLQRVLHEFVRGFVNELALMDSMIFSPFSHLKNQKQPVSSITLGYFEVDIKEWPNDRTGIKKYRHHDYLEIYPGSKGHPIGTVSISDSLMNCWDYVSSRQRKLEGKTKASTFDMTQYFSL